MTVEDLLNKKKLYFILSGRDYVIKCLNPEHDDSSPSMRIDSVLGIFHCLACGYKGNIFYLFGERFDKASQLRESLKRKIEDVRAQSIGLKMPLDAEPFDRDWRVTKATLQEFDAFKSLHSDHVNRVVFPIRDLKQKIVCFVGRSEDRFEKVKYKVTPAHSKIPFFPLHKLEPDKGRVMLVEGMFDLLNLWDNGYRNVLCTFGTTTVNKEKLNLLKILGINGIDICFDPDGPGQEAALKIREMAEEEFFNVRNVNLGNCDPGDLTPNRAEKLKAKLYE